MNLKEAAAREAALKTLLDHVKDAYDDARKTTRAALEAAADETGVRQVAVSLPDGPDVATVSLSSGEAAARVVDEDAYTAWVRDHYATEVERKFVTSVRQAFTDRLLKEMTAAGAAEYADPDTGVIHEVPGVAIAPARARTHNVRFKKDGRAHVMRALREGQLIAAVLPELTAGDTQ
jgi:DNA primase